jgi:diguanylate cyclase (GGDEF)-like protein
MNLTGGIKYFIERSPRPALFLVCVVLVVMLGAADLYWNLAAQIALFAILALLTTAIKDSLAREKEAARRDPLTGALNGKAFIELAWREINRSRRYRHTFTFAYMDVDGLKLVNDRFGRAAGDSLLLKITEAVKGNLRNVDAMSRLGGDEFAVMLPETGHEGAVVVMGRLHNLLADTVKQNGWPATFSIGVVTYKTPPDDIDAMVTRAERLMSQAKAAGKDMIRYDVY